MKQSWNMNKFLAEVYPMFSEVYVKNMDLSLSDPD